MANNKSKHPVKTTLGNYASSIYGKELMVSRAKVGKTILLVGSSLGVMPWQQFGGLVDDPRHLHIMTFDAAALDGCFHFLMHECKAPKEIGEANVYNLQRAAEEAFSKPDYDATFAGAVYEELYKVKEAASKGGIHVLIISSLTMLAKAWLRGISGPAFRVNSGSMFKSPMDQNKWNLLKQQLAEFQWQAQANMYHILWEAHHGEKVTKDDNTGMPSSLDTIQVDGSTAKSFPANVERIWEIKRTANPWKNADSKIFNKAVHESWFDPFPRFDFGEIQTGRKVSGLLDSKEMDLTEAFDKLGLTVGQWGV